MTDDGSRMIVLLGGHGYACLGECVTCWDGDGNLRMVVCCLLVCLLVELEF